MFGPICNAFKIKEKDITEILDQTIHIPQQNFCSFSTCLQILGLSGFISHLIIISVGPKAKSVHKLGQV